MKLLRLLAVLTLIIGGLNLNGQNCFRTGINGTVINLSCSQTCSTLVFQTPHIKSSEEYSLVTIPYNPFPYNTPTGSEDPVLYADDQYSFLVTLPFTFCFYGSNYTSAVVGSNGLITFDPANASCSNAWPITTTIPYSGGTICNSSTTYYPKASIMGDYSDLDPRTVASPANRKIQWEVIGTAPCRKFVVSYYRVGVFGSSCGLSTPNTFQMVIYESTGLIEINTEQKACGSSTNAGRGIQGIQDYSRSKALAVAGRNNSTWPDENNKSLRFVPSGATSFYQSCVLLDMGGTIVATADTLTTTPGLLDLSFNNFCPPPGNNQFVVRTRFSACDNPANILESLDTISVNRTNSLNATTSVTAATCGPPNGTITVTIAPGVGTPPFTYVLDGGTPVVGASPYTFTGVAAGPHTITITDAGGCTSTVNVTVNLNGNITAATSITAAACVGVNNGSITITSATGTGPYTFSLDGAAAVSGTIPFTFSNVSAGAHTIRVNDVGTGCTTGLINVNVAVGPGTSGNAISTPTSCPTATNGAITVTATSGTAPFTWSLDGAAAVPGANPFTFNGIGAGAHTVLIRDANGCQILIPVTVNAGNALTATYTTTATACSTAANGSITITSANGTAPYTFALDGGGPQAGSIPFTFNNVSSGNHTVIVTDATGCSSLGILVTVAAGPGVSGNATTQPTTCPTAVNGSITVTATAGTAPFTWSLDGGAAQAGASPYTFNNVGTGPHTITITDSYGCNVTLTNVVVNAGPGLTANTTATATSCSGATNGSITVTPVGGSAPFTFTIDGGAPQTGPIPFTFNNLSAGPHTIIVSDAAGCTTTSIIETVPVGPNLTTTVNTTDVLCNGGLTGVITVTVPTIGTPPYQYSLDGVTWQASNIFNGLAAGTYTVYYRESAGCQGSQSVTVNQPQALSATSSNIPVVCNGQPNGTITITTVGGVSPYQYSIDNGVNWQASNIFNVPAGSYTVIIKDANNCTTTQNITVTEPAALTASSVNTPASCDGGNNGTITVTANGGNSNYQYSVDGVNFQASNVFNLAPGLYTVTVKDNLGCTTTFQATIPLGNNLVFTPQTDPTICEGTSTQLQLNSNATVYSWTPATGLSSTTIANPVANPTVTTQYIVTATLQRCTVNDTVIVNVHPAPIPDAGLDGFICFGQTYQLQASGGTQYSWTPSTYLDNPSAPNPISSATRTTTYTLTVLSDVNGCHSLVTDNVTVDVTPPIRVTTLPFDTIAYAGEQIPFLAISGVPAANNFIWTPTTGLSNPAIANPILTAGNVGDVTQYKVTVSSAAGCKGEGFVTVKVYKGPELYTPTAFTPNGDGLNDLFYPFPVGIKSINYFRVYNRWGNLMFSSNVLYRGWDGKMEGVLQPSGVYVFMAEGVDKNGNKLTKKGTITLIR